MLKKSFKIVLFSFLCCVIVTAVWAQEFRFTSTADMTDHDDGLRDILNQIKNLVGDEGAFHIVPGDFDWDGTFPTLKAAFGNDVIWIPAIGNHDGDDKSQVNSHNQTLPFDINWGPRSCDLRTTFSFDYNNAHFVILDVYCADSGGDIDNALYAWLSDDLHATQQPAIFVVGHEPAYPHYRHVGSSLDDNSSHRDRFWQLLHDTGVVAYICGHTHDPEIHEEPGYDTLQVDVGQARGTGSHDAFVDFTVKDGEVEIKVYQGSGSFHLSDHRIVPIVPSTPPGPPYDLKVNTQGQGTVDINPPGGPYGEGTSVTLTAFASIGWIFNHWEGDLSGAVNPETITMDSHKTVTAIFIKDPAQMPVASFTAEPSSGDAPLFVYFDASGSGDPDGYIDFYTWDFGDGGSGSGVTASHEYNIPGTYTVTLTVTDNVDINNTATETVTVAGAELIEVRVSASSDDAEEKSSGSVGTSSSDLELVYDGSDQTVGMRFNGATIPQGAAIINAYIQFQVDETNSGATSLTIQGQDIGNAPTFSSSSGNISSRAWTATSVSWDPVPWTRTGEAGPDQQTPDIALVIQEIVNRSDWWSGNSLVIIITGTGERTAESYNGSSSGAPLLHVEYFASGQPPVDQPPSASIVSPDNDSTVFGTITIKVDASDAEDPVGTLGVEVQIDGGIWQSATYNSTSGYYELSWDTAAEGGGSYTIGFQATDSSGNTTNVSDAVNVTVSTQSPPVASFTATPSSGDAPLFVYFDASGSDDPDGTIVSYEWDFGDGGSGSGITASHEFNTPDTFAVILTVTDNNDATDTTTETVTVAGEELIEVQVSASYDDAEESQSGSVSRTSSDLELVRTSSNQIVGMRFNGATIPQGAAISNAYIQFQVDETDSEATSLDIQGQNIGNAPSFSSSSGNISSRAKTTASVPWEPVPWTQTGQAGPAQQTPDIAPVIQEIVNRLDWSSGNSLVIIITGTGKRVAESYNGSSSGAPLLHVEYSMSDPNHAPTGITLSLDTIEENADGAEIGQLTVSDPDVGDSHIFSVSDPRFEVVEDTLKLRTGESLDYETGPSIELDVTATDSGGLPCTETFNVIVVNVNEAPTDITLSKDTVYENADGAEVGQLTVSDQDVGDTHTFSVSDLRFEVVEDTLKLRTGESLDYETDPPVTLSVTATDFGDLSTTKTFTVTVLEINEAPTDIALSKDTVDENADGAEVGQLTVSDPNVGDTHTFSVSDPRFEVVEDTLKLRTGESLDYETDPPVTLSVTATDSGGLPLTETFNVIVLEINEAPTDIALSKDTVDENADGAEIGQLTVSDQDVGDTHTFNLSDDRFEVVGNTLKLRTGESLDYETDPPVEFEVTATDSGSLPFTKTFNVIVVNINEAPTAIIATTPGITPLAVDFDANGSSDPDNNIVSYAWDFGDTKTGSGVTTSHTYSTSGTYTVTLTVTDNDGASNSDQITITVNPPVTQTNTIEIRVATGNDDAEEKSSGSMSRGSSDLELVYDGGNQKVGMRFNGATIPMGATITNAYIQFQVDERNSGATSLTIQGQDIDNAPTFGSSSGDISSRARTTASVPWNPVPWTTTGQAGSDQQTPNIAPVIQEIVYRSDWSSGNSLVIIITGTGERTAESRNGSSSGAPLLHVEYTTGPVTNRAPSVDAGSNQTVTLPGSATLDATITDDGLPGSALTTTWSKLDGPGTVTFGDPDVVDTTASFSTDGAYELLLTADDGELTNSDVLTVTVYQEGTQANTIEIRVEADYDDAEERSSGSMSFTSTDLELVYDSGNQTVGMRFNGVNIPQGAAITNAYIQFQAEESHSGATSLTIQGQGIDNAPTFSSSSGNISSRARTTAFVPWNPVPWTTGQAGLDQQTPNIALIIQQIVSRQYWSSGNSLVIIITGTGERSAESYDGRPSGAPLLHVEYHSP